MNVGCLPLNEIITCLECGTPIRKGHVTEPIELCKKCRLQVKLRLQNVLIYQTLCNKKMGE